MKKSIILNIALSVINVFLVLIIILSKNDNKLLIDDTKPNQLLGIMLEKEVASGVYEKSSDSTWPTEGYVFNPTLSNCENGSQITWQDGKIIVNTITSDKCYVYFDKPKTFTLLTAKEIENEDAKLTNILGTDGNFEDEGIWLGYGVLSTEYKKYGNYSCKISSVAEAIETTTTSKNQYYLNSTHMYYMKILVYSKLYKGVQVYWPIIEPSFFSTFTSGWSEISSISNRSSFMNGSYNVRIDFNNNYTAGEMYFDGLMIIDLTESYGENIPTKEWLDKNLLYFDNSVNIKTVEGFEGEFNITDASGTFRCSEGGEATIKDGKVIIKGTKENTTCVLE